MGGAASVQVIQFSQADALTIANRLQNVGENFKYYSKIIVDEDLSGFRFTNLVSKPDITRFLIDTGITNVFDARVISQCIMVWRDPSLLISCNNSIDPVTKQIPFPKMGVRLSVFREFIMECGGESEVRSLSTTDVCNRFLKPLTYADGASYCEYYHNYGSDSEN
eukprot:gene54129-72343_t